VSPVGTNVAIMRSATLFPHLECICCARARHAVRLTPTPRDLHANTDQLDIVTTLDPRVSRLFCSNDLFAQV
jgi:hypothetical protein